MSSTDFEQREAKRRAHAQQAAARVRDIRLWWERNPDGPIITRALLPLGMRTREGFVWGHRLAHFFWLQRIPGVNAMTIWSRSMLREFGEGYAEHDWDEPLVEPRVLRPWPVLRLASTDDDDADDAADDDADACASEWGPPMGAIDGGCGCEHAEQVRYAIRAQETYAPRECDAPGGGVAAELGVAPDEPQDADVQMLDASAPAGDARPEQVSASAVPAGEPDQDVKGSAAKAAEDEEKKDEDEDEDPSDEDDEDGSTSDEDEHRSDREAEPTKPAVPPTPATGLFSVEALPKLEEFIPEEFFPDVLMVHDPDNTTNQRNFDKSQSRPIKYIRHRPEFERDDEGSSEPCVAHLRLAESNRLGSGHHSYVYRAPLTLPSPLSAHSPTGQVTVAAKLAYSKCSAHNLLRNEARAYDAFPKHIQQEYCGYHIVPQSRFPVPVVPIVPKFYGYYLPTNDRGDVLDSHHSKCSEARPCNVDWPSPILLMEECGSPVEPAKFTIDQRTECFSLIQRLHFLEIIQGSFYVRNIMIQPGPLTAPPAARSFDSPSFRIIDFGRGEDWEHWMATGAHRTRQGGNSPRAAFVAELGDELHRARGELLIEDLGY
ncbi:hypothetical protein BC628DRAFT_1423422 [Trametes gibbosa]|nr:hypothetical protein BC628DRAFT_1423422 [Trametes gibbosa]